MRDDKGRAASYRAKHSKPVTLPSGAVFILRTIPLQIWWKKKKLPQQFMAAALNAQKDTINLEAAGQDYLAQASSEEQQSIADFMFDAVAYSMVSPKLVEGGTGDDELDPDELDPNDYNFIFAYACGQADQQTTPTKDGEVAVDSVAAFRDSGQDEPLVDTGNDVPVVPSTTAV